MTVNRGQKRAASVVAIALGAAAYAPVVATPASGAESGIRYDSSETEVIKKADQKPSDNLESCTFGSGKQSGENSGFSYLTYNPDYGQRTGDPREFGLVAKAGPSGDRTFVDIYASDSRRIEDFDDPSSTVRALSPGEERLGFLVNREFDPMNFSPSGRYLINLNGGVEINEDDAEAFASGDGVTFGWVGEYTSDWVPKGEGRWFEGSSLSITATVNPWPNENSSCEPIEIRWNEDISRQVIRPGEKVLVGTVDTKGDEDSLSRIRVSAFRDDGQEVPGDVAIEGDEVYYTMTDYKDESLDYNGDNSLTFTAVAVPRSLDDLKKSAVDNSGQDSAADSIYPASNSLPRYSTANFLSSRTFTLDDTNFHDPGYDKQSKSVISGIIDSEPNNDPQIVTFSESGDSIANLVKDNNASVELNTDNVFDGWEARFVDAENGDYTVEVTTPAGEDMRPGTFAQPVVEITYSNGSKDFLPLLVSVTPNDTQTTDAKYPEKVTRGVIGEDMSASPRLERVILKNKEPVTPVSYSVDESTVPEGWTVSVDESGNVTANSGTSANAGDIATVRVTATYPDGTVDTPSLSFMVGSDADINVPDYDAKTTRPGKTVSRTVENAPEGATFSIANSDVDGWSYDINPDTGEVTATAPGTAQGGDRHDIAVTVTYPDGSSEDVAVTTIVAHPMAYESEAGYANESVYPGASVTSPLSVEKPAEVNYASERPFALIPGDNYEETGEANEFGNPVYRVATDSGDWMVSLDADGNVVASSPEGAQPGDIITARVKVTYEDGSSDEAVSTISVKDNPTRQVPFAVEYTYDPNLPAGSYEVDVTGVPGTEKQQADGSWTRASDPVNEVVRIGVKPSEANRDVTWTAPIPYSTTMRANPDLAPGETRKVSDGINGERTYMAKFTATGGEAKVVESEDTKPAIDEVIEYGPALEDGPVVSTTTRPLDFPAEYIEDDTLESGTVIVDQQGEMGEEKVTSTQNIEGGRLVGEARISREVTKEPVKSVIRVGTKKVVETTTQQQPVPTTVRETERVTDTATETQRVTSTETVTAVVTSVVDHTATETVTPEPKTSTVTKTPETSVVTQVETRDVPTTVVQKAEPVTETSTVEKTVVETKGSETVTSTVQVPTTVTSTRGSETVTSVVEKPVTITKGSETVTTSVEVPTTITKGSETVTSTVAVPTTVTKGSETVTSTVAVPTTVTKGSETVTSTVAVPTTVTREVLSTVEKTVTKDQGTKVVTSTVEVPVRSVEVQVDGPDIRVTAKRGTPFAVKVTDPLIESGTLRFEGGKDTLETGEGVWRVNTKTNEVSFTPRADFFGAVPPVDLIYERTDGAKLRTPVRIEAIYTDESESPAGEQEPKPSNTPSSQRPESSPDQDAKSSQPTVVDTPSSSLSAEPESRGESERGGSRDGRPILNSQRDYRDDPRRGDASERNGAEETSNPQEESQGSRGLLAVTGADATWLLSLGAIVAALVGLLVALRRRAQ